MIIFAVAAALDANAIDIQIPDDFAKEVSPKMGEVTRKKKIVLSREEAATIHFFNRKTLIRTTQEYISRNEDVDRKLYFQLQRS